MPLYPIALIPANNLSDLGSASAARANLGLGSIATMTAAGLLTGYRQAASGVVPSATQNTNGTAVTIAADSGFTGFMVLMGDIVSTGVASETVTVKTVATYADNTTNTATGLTTITSNTTTNFGASTLLTMLGTSVDTKYVKQIAFQVQSTINSSAASLTFNIVGLNLL